MFPEDRDYLVPFTWYGAGAPKPDLWGGQWVALNVPPAQDQGHESPEWVSEDPPYRCYKRILLRQPQGLLGYQKEPELISPAVLCWEQNRCSVYLYKTF